MSGLRYASHHVVLEPSRFQVRIGQDVVTPEPKVFELLSYLMRHAGRVVSKAELLDSLWAGDVVGESVLTRCMSCARKLLSDDSKTPRFIRTLHGRGYEFIAPVTTLARAEGTARDQPSTPSSESSIATESASPPLVGRRTEAQRLKTALARLETRSGDFILISGEPGIGKSRLLEETRSLAPHAIEAHFARALAVPGAPPFYVWQQLLRSIVRTRSLKTVARAFEDAPSGARKLLLGTDRWGADQLGWDSPSERFRTFDAVARGLAGLAEERPLALLLDDLHAADLVSLLLLSFLAQAPGLPLLLVGTLRDTERPGDAARATALAQLRAACKSELALSGLQPDEVRQFVAQRGAEPSTALAEQLLSRTAGNPFLLSVLAWAPHSDRAAAVPIAAHGAVSQRLAALDPGCAALLRAAAVFGPSFEAALLAEVAGEPIERCLGWLSQASEARVLVRQGPDEYRFVHDLIREALYDGIPPHERPALHLAVGKALQALPRFRDARSAAVLAHHFTRAAHAGGASDALDLSIRAGAFALRNFAYEEAIDHFKSAQRLLPLAAETDQATECAVLLDLGLAQISAGEREAGQRTLHAAAERARELGSASELASVALNLAPGLFAIETGVYDPLLVGLLREALQQTTEAEPKRRALLLARLALALYWSDTFAERERACAEARALAEQAGTDDVLSAVATAQVFALLRPSNLEERHSQSEQALELCRRSADHHGLLMNRLLRAAMFLEVADMPAARFEVEAFRALAETTKAPQALWIVEAQRANQLFLDGRLEQVEQLAGACLFAGQRVHDHNALLTFGVHLTLVRIEQARAAEVLDVIRDYAVRYPRIIAWRVVYAYALLCSGRRDECALEYESLKRAGFALPDDLNWMTSMSWLAEMSHALNDAEAAAQLYPQLQPYAARLVVIGYAGIACRGSVERFLGLLAATRGDTAARQHYERALTMNRSVSATLPLLQTLCDYAAWATENGDEDGARRLRAEAAPLVAERNLPRVKEQLERIGR
jgi:DNA-binding winged helix-turn-helix (wHTH) protein